MEVAWRMAQIISQQLDGGKSIENTYVNEFATMGWVLWNQNE